MHLLYSTNLFKSSVQKYVLHVPYTNKEPCPDNSHWPVTQLAFWSSLGAVNTYSLYFYLWYCNKNFNRTCQACLIRPYMFPRECIGYELIAKQTQKFRQVRKLKSCHPSGEEREGVCCFDLLAGLTQLKQRLKGHLC